MKRIPLTARELIEQLDQDYPARSPQLTDSDRQIWMQAGERRLIESLLQRLKYTEDAARGGV